MNKARTVARLSGWARTLENRTPQPNINKRNRRKMIAAQHRLERRVEAAVITAKENRPRVISSLKGRLDKMTRDELRKVAADRKIIGRGSMTKAELIEALS